MTDSPRTTGEPPSDNLLDILAGRVWDDPAFQTAARWAEVARLRKELNLAAPQFEEGLTEKLIQAAAILSAARNPQYRQAAYRIATNVHYLLSGTDRSAPAALRVVLSRLSNFPAMATNSTVADSVSMLPLTLLLEELAAAEERSVSVGQRVSTLTDFQLGLWRTFASRRDVAVTAPTSAGKSYVLQNYLNSRFLEAGSLSVVYLVPTRALISQVTEDLEKSVQHIAGSRPRIITVPPDATRQLPPRAIYVFTPERLQLLLGSHPEFAPAVVVVDEAHLIADGARGVLLQWVLDDVLAKAPKPQILFASPTISNLSLFSRLFAIDDMVHPPSAEPTVAQNFILVSASERDKGVISLASVGDGTSNEVPLGTLEISHPLWSRYDRLAYIPAVVGKGRLNIVYVNGSADAERIALILASLQAENESTPAQIELAQIARGAVHPRYVLSQCLLRGVGFHYSTMPATLRIAIEHAFERGELSFMVCTSTLLQGVNTPAQNIFMYAPEKGSGRPLSAVDFWNLAGRAGRLGREFQGNIFLIDYGSWRSQPLTGPKASEVRPAIRAGIADTAELLKIIYDVPQQRPLNRLDLESTFSRLLADFQRGSLGESLRRAGLSPQDADAKAIVKAIASASERVSIPPNILKQSANVSAHKQQRLYDFITESILRNPKTAKTRLSPPHPWKSNAYEAYSSILQLCYRIIWERPEQSKLHRFHALIALWWMKGHPLPRIIQNQLTRENHKDQRRVIRETLTLVEDHIRFRAVRVFTTYNSLLALAYEEAGIKGGVESIPSIPLFLELGASNRTMISLIELGMTRATAAELSERTKNKSMDQGQALAWIRGLTLEALGLSPGMLREILSVAARPEAAIGQFHEPRLLPRHLT